MIRNSTHRLSPSLTQIDVVLVATSGVGVPLDADESDFRMGVEDPRNVEQQSMAALLNHRAVHPEEHPVQDFQTPIAENDLLFLNAPPILHRSGFVRTVVFPVHDTVAIPIRIRTSTVFNDSRFVAAFIDIVKDAVPVIVWVWTAVVVLEVVLVFWLSWTFIAIVAQPITIEIPRVGATVAVLQVVVGLGLVDALIVDIKDSVLIIVRVGTAIEILKLIQIFWLLGTAVVAIDKCRHRPNPCRQMESAIPTCQ